MSVSAENIDDVTEHGGNPDGCPDCWCIPSDCEPKTVDPYLDLCFECKLGMISI